MLDKLGNYRIYESIFEREPGPVYRGEEISKGLEVAVQILHPHLTEAKETREACAHESKSLASLNHPNIARFQEFFIEGERCVYIYELLLGKTLDQKIAEKPGPLGFSAAFRLMAPVLSGLDFAHGQGVLHGGIRPANVMIVNESGDPVVKLLGFGIAMGLHGGKGSKYIGARMDSFCYLAPEQLEEEGKIDERADIYSAAVVLYELVTGEGPYRFDSIEKFSQNMSMRLLPPTPRSIHPDIPKDLEEIILKGISPDRGERFQSARAFLDALEMLDGGQRFEGAAPGSGVDEATTGTSDTGTTTPPGKKTGPKVGTGGISTPPVASGSPVVDKSFHDAVEKIRQRERETAGPTISGAPPIQSGSSQTRETERTRKERTQEPPIIPPSPAPSSTTEQKQPASGSEEEEGKKSPLARIIIVALVVAAILFLFLKSRNPEEEKPIKTAEEMEIEKVDEEIAPEQESAPDRAAAVPEGMILVPGGTFQAGNDQIEGSPVHEATLSPFFADILQQQNNVSWYEADEACSRRGLRLPTEHEWEMAAQMGLIEIGPNADWVQDWYGDDAYAKSSGRNPQGPSRVDCTEDPGDWQAMRKRLDIDERCCKVLRGFVWDGCEDSITCRSFWGPDQSYKNRAFRCVKERVPEE